MGRGKKNAAEMISRLVDIGVDVIMKLGVDQDLARTSMRKIANSLCAEYGGGVMYIPKDREYGASERDEKIWNEFSGDNVPELAKRYDLTEQMIYQIIREQRAMFRKRSQSALPGFEEDGG